MDEQLFKILKKIYNKKRYFKDEKGKYIAIENGDIFDSTTCKTIYSTDILSSKEMLYLNQSGYAINEIVYATHDETIHKLKEIIQHPHLSLDNLLTAYIAGFGSFPRGRQPILSYLFARAVPVHTFCKSSNGNICEICSLEKEYWVQKGEEIFRNYWGYSWNEIPSTFYYDLVEFSKLDPIIATEEDYRIFYSVIDMIRHAPKGETPGQLEQRIKKAKLIPKCEKYRLRGQLMTLAELGVMPNQYIPPLFDEFTDSKTYYKVNKKIHGSPRSDIVLPLNAWRGENGICEKRFEELFGTI